jgi:ATP phosphoribosyltransferase regulatory subunit
VIRALGPRRETSRAENAALLKARQFRDFTGRALSVVDPRAEAVAAHLCAAGYARHEPPILQPASIFFESGEDLRGQLYLTSDVTGADYCLRPEYTIPVCRHYLGSGEAGESAAFSYCGPVFRFQEEGPSEFVQAGVESFGRADREAADAEILALTLEAMAKAGAPRDLVVAIGDAGLFSGLLASLDLPPQWQRRIARGHAHGKPVAAVLDTAVNGSGIDHSGLLALLEGADRGGARALVEDLLRIAGVSAVGGRTAGEIADRFLEQAALRTAAGVPTEKLAVIDAFLAIEGSPDEAIASLRRLAEEAKLDLGPALDRFDARLRQITAQGIDVAALAFAARFTRNLDYYTGFVFEVLDPARQSEKPVAGGGRYDQLLQRLGADREIPAVGAAIRIDRLGAAAGEETP